MNLKGIYRTLLLFFCVGLISCSALVSDFKNLNRSVSYTIENYFESASSENFELKSKSELKIGFPETEIPYESEGFTLDSEKSGVFKENGSTYVRYYYKRNIVVLTFDSGGGIWISPKTKEESGEQILVKGKFESKVSVPDTTNLVKNTYTFKGWDSEVPELFPLSDKTFTAEWDSGTSNASVIDTVKDDIEIEKNEDKSDSSKITFKVKVPYSGDWKYEWYIDKVLQTETSSSMAQTFSAGSHEISILAKEGGNVFSKTISVQVKEAGNEELN